MRTSERIFHTELIREGSKGRELSYEPVTKGLDGEFLICAQLPVRMLDAVSDFVKIGDEEELKKYIKHINKLGTIRTPGWVPVKKRRRYRKGK